MAVHRLRSFIGVDLSIGYPRRCALRGSVDTRKGTRVWRCTQRTRKAGLLALEPIKLAFEALNSEEQLCVHPITCLMGYVGCNLSHPVIVYAWPIHRSIRPHLVVIVSVPVW
jgi:hypothetical protein